MAGRAAHELALANLQVARISRIILALVVKISVDGRQGLAQFRRQMLHLLRDSAHSQNIAPAQGRAKLQLTMGVLNSKYMDRPRNFRRRVMEIGPTGVVFGRRVDISAAGDSESRPHPPAPQQPAPTAGCPRRDRPNSQCSPLAAHRSSLAAWFCDFGLFLATISALAIARSRPSHGLFCTLPSYQSVAEPPPSRFSASSQPSFTR